MTALPPIGYRQWMMRFLNNRLNLPRSRFNRALILFLSAGSALCLAGCPKNTPPPTPAPPPPPPGDTLRLSGKVGDKAGGNVKVRLEKTEVGGTKKAKVFAFQLEEEHTVETADDKGNMHLVGKFFNIEAQGDTPKEKKAGEAMARGLSEIQIAYDLSNRGEVKNFEVKNVPDSYLSDARQIAAWVYGADHGPIFDSGPIEASKSWKIHAEVPIPAGGTKNWDLNCSYAKKEQNLATVTLEGKVTGESHGTQLTGELKGEIRLNLAKGAMVYHELDSHSTFRPGGDPAAGHQVHVHATWEAQDSAAAAAAPSADGKAAAAKP